MARRARGAYRQAGAGGRAGGQAVERVAGAGVGARSAGRERTECAAWARGARGWAHGARGARPAGSTGAQPVRAGWARLGFCAPGLVFSLFF